MKLELFRIRKAFLIIFVVTFGLLLTAFILENIFSSSKVFDFYADNYTFFLLGGGFIISSLAFGDLGNPLRRQNYLNLPASSFEKLLSMWLLTCAGWIIVFTMIYIVYALIAYSTGHFFFRNTTFPSYNPMEKIPFVSLAYYIAFQAIFLVGAVHFRGYVFPKTIFALLLFAIFCGLIFYAIMADIIHTADQCPPGYNPFTEKPLQQFLHIAGGIGIWIIAPVCWVITYMGLKQQEV
jgi:hypothetical protein